jgi:hypothetical protein
LSSHIVAEMERAGLSPEAARQRISRVRGEVLRLNDVHFANREKFLFLRSQYRSPEFSQNLRRDLISTGSAYGNVIAGLESRGGSVLKALAPIASGLSVSNATGHVLHETAVARLREHKLIREESAPSGELVLSIPGTELTSHDRAVFQVEQIVLGVLAKWIGNTGIGSSGKIHIRDESQYPTYGQFAWDLVAPSYLGAITTFKNGAQIPGFVAAEINLGRNISKEHIRPFISKWDALRGQRRATRLQPIYIGRFFEPSALLELRKRGCLIGIPDTLFGQEAAEALLKLVATIEHAAIAVVKEPEAVFKLLGRVAKIEGAALNIRGVLFEMIVGRLFNLQGFHIDIRKVCKTDTGEKVEIDVRGRRQDQIICCECKGMSPGNLVSREEIEDWESRQLPRIKNWMKNADEIPNDRRFVFWSSSGYSREAMLLIKELKNKYKRTPIEFLTGKDMENELRGISDNALQTIFREQFGEK